MSSSLKVPPILEAYLKVSLNDLDTSCTLLTSTLGATSNWLLLRLLYQALIPRDPTSKPVRLLLISFVEDFEFFNRGAKRITTGDLQCNQGLNLLMKSEQFKFICGLNTLYGREMLMESPLSETSENSGPRLVSARIQAEILEFLGQSSQGVQNAVVLDGLDVLLATGHVSNDELELLISTIIEHEISLVLTLCADLPFVTDLETNLERQHGAFLLSMAHLSNLIISLRTLESGVAKDVSGVLRARVNQSSHSQCEDGSREFLYFVGRDSNVRIFERGEL